MVDITDVYRNLCDGSFDLLQVVTVDGHFLYVNRTWRETLGYGPEEITGLNFFDVIHPDSRSWYERACSQLPDDPGSCCRIRFRRKNGEEVVAEGMVSCLSPEGQPGVAYGVFRRAGGATNAEEELGRLFSLSLDFLCVAGIDGYFKQINPAFLQVLGYSRDELLRRPFLDFVHPDDREPTLRAVEQLARGLTVVDFQNRYRASDGTYRWLAWHSTPWADRGLIYAVARDITEQRKIQELMRRQAEELARSNTDLEQFAYVASHDLRAPLRSAANLAEWIEEDMHGELPERVKNHLEKLRRMVRRMEKLTDELLQYARAGRVSEQISLVDTAALLRELTFLLSPPEGFTVNWDPGMPVFETARYPLEQVFRNLIGNAIKHHHRNDGTVRVTVHDRPGFYEFSIADDGPGIPAESHARIFTMFHTLHASARVESHGIGLALVKRVVETNGGTVRVESAEGSGATFSFTWPKRIDQIEGSRASHSHC